MAICRRLFFFLYFGYPLCMQQVLADFLLSF